MQQVCLVISECINGNLGLSQKQVHLFPYLDPKKRKMHTEREEKKQKLVGDGKIREKKILVALMINVMYGFMAIAVNEINPAADEMAVVCCLVSYLSV